MKINSIQKNMPTNSQKMFKNKSLNHTNSIENIKSPNDSFAKSISFKGGRFSININGEQILKNSEQEMFSLGEYFLEAWDHDIKYASKVRKKMGFKDKIKSKLAYEKLSLAIEKVKEYKKGISDELSSLKIKETMGMENILDQKNRVTNQFFKFVKQEGKGETPPITNGILIYGSSKIKNDEFVQWFAKETPTCFERIEHNHKEPLKTLDKIMEKADDAEASFKITKKRTILFVDKLDDLFTDDSTREGRNLIGRFKGIIENISAKSHTTILMKTTKPLEDFEEASIGGQRFGLKVAVKDALSEEEHSRLEKIKKEIARLYWKADSLDPDINPNSPIYDPLFFGP